VAHEFFAGINYYLYGHKLKWQNGVEYTTASNSGTNNHDYNGWGFTSAFRLSW
jgi:phosphate-selective porin OprO/OprP